MNTKASVRKKTNSLFREAAAKVFPIFKQERTKSFLIISLTLLALIIFGLFAINPTIATIVQLRKQLADNTYAYNQLIKKVNDLSVLQGKYNNLQPELPIVLAAIPDTDHISEFLGQTQALAAKNNVQIISMQSNPLILTAIQPPQATSLSFSVTIQGSRQNILTFITSFMKFERIVTPDEVLFSTTNTEQGIETQALIQGKVYFQSL